MIAVTINGQKVHIVKSTTLKALPKLFAPGADLTILNGFATDQDLPIKAGDTISLIKRGEMPPREELESMLSARHTPGVYAKLKSACVAVAGLGGLGSNIAAMLARSGVGRLALFDYDVVEPSNLNRQNYYISHLGMYKTDATKQLLLQMNPFLVVETHCVKLTKENAAALLRSFPVVCEALDGPADKAMLAEALLPSCPGVKLISGSGMAGFESANTIHTVRRMKNLYLCGDSETEARPGNGLMAPRCTVCAAHQANMALRLILGLQEP